MISYSDFIEKYPYFKTLDPDFRNRIDITTITIVGKFKTIMDIEKLGTLKSHLSNDFIHTIIADNKNTYTVSNLKRKYEKKFTKKARDINVKQITLKTNIDNDIILSLKIFASGIFHITGTNNISNVFWVFYRLFELLRELNLYDLSFNDIESFNIEMINCKCYFPGIIDQNILYNELLTNKNILSVHYDPIRHSAIKVKILKEHAINEADVLILLIFAYGKILITRGLKYSDIIYAYKKFYTYLALKSNSLIEYDKEIINTNLRDELKIE